MNTWSRSEAIAPLLIEKGARLDYDQVGTGFDPFMAIKHRNVWTVNALLNAANDAQRDWWATRGLPCCELQDWPEGHALILSHLARHEAQSVVAELSVMSNLS